MINRNIFKPEQNGRNFAATYSNASHGNETFLFSLEFHWSAFLRFHLTISQHCFRLKVWHQSSTKTLPESLMTHILGCPVWWSRAQHINDWSTCQAQFRWLGDYLQFVTMVSWWAQWRLKSPASRVFAQPFAQVRIKENIKAPRHWRLWGESTGERWILLT